MFSFLLYIGHEEIWCNEKGKEGSVDWKLGYPVLLVPNTLTPSCSSSGQIISGFLHEHFFQFTQRFLHYTRIWELLKTCNEVKEIRRNGYVIIWWSLTKPFTREKCERTVRDGVQSIHELSACKNKPDTVTFGRSWKNGAFLDQRASFWVSGKTDYHYL